MYINVSNEHESKIENWKSEMAWIRGWTPGFNRPQNPFFKKSNAERMRQNVKMRPSHSYFSTLGKMPTDRYYFS